MAKDIVSFEDEGPEGTMSMAGFDPFGPPKGLRTTRITLPEYPGQGANAKATIINIVSKVDGHNISTELTIEGQPATTEEYVRILRLIEGLL
jgi:hypothetical protein